MVEENQGWMRRNVPGFELAYWVTALQWLCCELPNEMCPRRRIQFAQDRRVKRERREKREKEKREGKTHTQTHTHTQRS